MLPLTPPTPTPTPTPTPPQKVTEDVQFVARAAVVKEQTFEERLLFLLEPFTNEVWGLLAAAIAVRAPHLTLALASSLLCLKQPAPYTFCAQSMLRRLLGSLICCSPSVHH